jgi:hypothetical protein
MSASPQARAIPFQGVRLVVQTSASFDTVTTRLRAQMGRANIADLVALVKESRDETAFSDAVNARYVGESGFMLFAELDHGWIARFGIRRRTVRWILGNPLIAITMIRWDISAGLFAPVEILITDHQDGQGTDVIYVRPSSLMVIEANPPLLAAALELDKKLDALVTNATAQ